MAGVAQLVRAAVCGTVGRGFKSPHSPQSKSLAQAGLFDWQSDGRRSKVRMPRRTFRLGGSLFTCLSASRLVQV